jgi:hypothetical protein
MWLRQGIVDSGEVVYWKIVAFSVMQRNYSKSYFNIPTIQINFDIPTYNILPKKKLSISQKLLHLTCLEI